MSSRSTVCGCVKRVGVRFRRRIAVENHSRRGRWAQSSSECELGRGDFMRLGGSRHG
jgi:hypothetical protein